MAGRRVKKYQLNLRIIDAAEELRKLFGKVEFMGRDLTIPDYRFEIDTPSGGTVTFNQEATASHVIEYVKREGWEI